MSEDRTDRRHIGQSHIQRINDWIGSDSYLEGARRDPEDTIMYDSEKHPFILMQKAEHAGRLLRPGAIVHLHPEEVGTHHAKLSTHKYPDHETLKDMLVVTVDASPLENEIRPEPTSSASPMARVEPMPEPASAELPPIPRMGSRIGTMPDPESTPAPRKRK